MSSLPILLLVTAYYAAGCSVSAFLHVHRRLPTTATSSAPPSHLPPTLPSRRAGATLPPPPPPPPLGRGRGGANSPAAMTMVRATGYKSPDEGNSYNDDAFGLVFIAGGVLSRDVDFVATFATLSAAAAAFTGMGLVPKDERAPAVVATSTLLLSPFVASIRQHGGSLEYLSTPIPVEIGVCLISVIWSFVNNKSRGEERETD